MLLHCRKRAPLCQQNLRDKSGESHKEGRVQMVCSVGPCHGLSFVSDTSALSVTKPFLSSSLRVLYYSRRPINVSCQIS